MSESHHPSPELPKLQSDLHSLGDKFIVGWNYILGDLTDSQQAVFLEKLAKLDPIYLDYIKRLIKEATTKDDENEKEMAEFYQKNPHFKPKTEPSDLENQKKYLANFATTFIKKIEFFSRINSPEQITSGGKTAEQLEIEARRANIRYSEFTRQKMREKEFITSKELEQINLVRLKVKDLFGDDQDHTLEEIIQKAKEFGLEPCQAEDGPAYRLAYTLNGELKKEQPMNEWISIAMEPMTDSDAHPRVFHVKRNEDGVWLDAYWAGPDAKWGPEGEFVFRLPVSSKKDNQVSNSAV